MVLTQLLTPALKLTNYASGWKQPLLKCDPCRAACTVEGILHSASINGVLSDMSTLPLLELLYATYMNHFQGMSHFWTSSRTPFVSFFL